MPNLSYQKSVQFELCALLLWARWLFVEVRFPHSSTFDVSVMKTENKYMYS
jgi:hypothetical protein